MGEQDWQPSVSFLYDFWGTSIIFFGIIYLAVSSSSCVSHRLRLWHRLSCPRLEIWVPHCGLVSIVAHTAGQILNHWSLWEGPLFWASLNCQEMTVKDGTSQMSTVHKEKYFYIGIPFKAKLLHIRTFIWSQTALLR